MSEIIFAACSWKYDSWRGVIYPYDEQINYLQEYAKYYKSVEVDQWFWSLFGYQVKLPDPRIVKEYKESVPDDFLFTIKVPNSLTLTHYYKKNKAETLIKNPHFLSIDLFEQFIDTLNPLHDQIGSLIFQFEYLNKEKIPSLQQFQNYLHEFFQNIPKDSPPISIEIRNPNYLNENYFRFINELGIAHVFLEGYFMPPIYGIYEKHKNLIKNYSIIRLHGPERSGIEKLSGENWNQIYINRDNELESILEIIKDMQNRDVSLYINVNNHFEGSAPLTIKKIQQRITKD